MSNFGGKKREVKEFEGFAKYVGFFKGDVVAINPDRSQLNKLLGREDKPEDKEIDYTGDKEGVDFARVTFWLSAENHDNLLLSHTITIKNEVRRNKSKEKIQLINQVGDTTWVEADEDNEFNEETIFDSFKNFTNVTEWLLPNGEISPKYEFKAKPAPGAVEVLGPKKYRPALIGEEELAEFLKKWLNFEYKDPETDILLDTRKLFGGNFKILQEQVGTEVAVFFVALAYVRVDEEDGDKQYQRIFKKLLPANFMKFINNGCKFPNNFTQKKWDEFVAECEGEYGPDGAYVLEPLKAYDPQDDFATSKSTKADVTETNSKY